MAAITNHNTLRLAVMNYMGYDDVDDNFELFLGLAEAKMARDLRLPCMVTSKTLTLTSNEYGNPASLSAGFLEAISLTEIFLTGSGDTRAPLIYLPPQRFFESQDFRVQENVAEYPTHYTIRGDYLWFSPRVKTGTVVYYDFAYYTLDELRGLASTKSTPVLLKAPDLYLYAVLREAYTFVSDPAREMEMTGKYQQCIEALNKDAATHAHGRMNNTIIQTNDRFII